MKLLNCYWKPTPKKWRIIGDSLLAAMAYANTFDVVRHNDKLAMTILFVGVIGKYVTNFFKKKKDET